MLILVIWENEIFISVTSDPQFFPFVNCAIDPPSLPPCTRRTTLEAKKGAGGSTSKGKIWRKLTQRVLNFFSDMFLAQLSRKFVNLRWLNRVMQDDEERGSDLNRKLIFSFFLLFS